VGIVAADLTLPASLSIDGEGGARSKKNRKVFVSA
jgi:hypothetical protein